MNKIAIIGSGGAGKSTLAVALAKQLDLPLYHLDRLYWGPNWQRAERPAWAQLQQQLCGQQSWIIDGNYFNTLDIRLAACDTVIFLDVDRYRCIYRAVKRTLFSNHRPDMAEGCHERFDWTFIKFLWHYPTNMRPRIYQQLACFPHKDIVVVSSGAQAIEQMKQRQLNKG
ncbi:hypothetical protein [Motilimonas sp. E26]|uniref:hypothetical protein n=1 Tax=Motilimonas sp. E26 TaxID=2865674 RepID=UPI001E39818C|nr:hypothetical protein [Motilimonas sp. E26]MCE0556021.1 hypothetical protein [Motilimonas sp. E26]